ncbi:MAG: hypothetical protein IJN31_05570 [Peptococcaceae bacterium]|nr:hypothetical protein [Peptococcaceae bacterium]
MGGVVVFVVGGVVCSPLPSVPWVVSVVASVVELVVASVLIVTSGISGVSVSTWGATQQPTTKNHKSN